MKLLTFSRLALLICAFSTAGATTILAQDDSSSSSTTTSSTTTTPPPAGHHWHHGAMLTSDERAELKKDMESVMTNNPDLKTEGETLKQQMHDHMEKVDAAIVSLDPAAAPILAKLKAAHHHHGPPPQDDQGGDQSGQ